ncbi:translation initiation factor IF-2-like [Prionailurus viverrinus]|uniref:translation initiation factor IF-2-like n=1 Tax=Prionailurus viverrinus TaxID=61388 RepID=UPI001FF20637|nr:translation initiation factor IF-2-like [Prionailurus viverrinus]
MKMNKLYKLTAQGRRWAFKGRLENLGAVPREQLAHPRVPSTLGTLRVPGVPVFPSALPPAVGLGLPRPRTARPRAPAGPHGGREGRRCRASPAPRRWRPRPGARPRVLGSPRPPGARASGRGRGLTGGLRGAAGGARADGRGSPAPEAGHPEARADLPRRARRAGGRRGGGRTARAAAGCAHRWAAAAKARRSGAGVLETPAVTPRAQRLRAGKTRPRLGRNRPFSPPPRPLWLQPHLGPGAQVTSFPRSFFGRGGARGPPTSSRSAEAGEGRPAPSRSGGAGRRL